MIGIGAFFRCLEQHAHADARPALIESGKVWRYADLLDEVARREQHLRALGIHTVATLLDNGAQWVLWDLAALRAGVVHVPIPGFYAPQQIQRTLLAAHANGLVTYSAASPAFAAAGYTVAAAQDGIDVLVNAAVLPARLPEETTKITFTSGSTGDPKGVCLSASALLTVADSIHTALLPVSVTAHLCALPFAVLLENIAGLYAPLLNGASCVVLPMAQVGLQGASAFDAARFDQTVRHHAVHSVVLLPQMLRAWVGHLHQHGLRAPANLAFAAVGGAAVSPALLLAAERLGIPVFEGYGLSEGASVQTLNVPGLSRPGSVGRPLPHCRLRVADDGEILIRGSMASGYLDSPVPTRDHWLPTGDLGRIDPDGFVHITGRKKNLLITAFGRNVSPEWVETQLQGSAAIGQAVVLGDAMPQLGAVIWPLQDSASDAELAQAVAHANAALPDYARVQQWVRAVVPFSVEAGTATANGRPRRLAIADLHPFLLQQLQATAWPNVACAR